MGNIVLFMHTSLDGYAAGTQGEMNWINVDQELFDYVEERIAQTNTAIYGRKTFEMMEGYWPTAADKPGATKHDKVHSAWYKNARKVVLSNTLNESDFTNTTVINKDHPAAIREIKANTTGDILVFGSPSATHALLAEGLIDETWIFVNPVLLGDGKPVFKDIKERMVLQLVKTHTFSSGVVCLQHLVKR